MTEDYNDAVEPKGIGITITDTERVIVNFDHGDIPPINLSMQGAEKVGSHISTAADKARNPNEYES